MRDAIAWSYDLLTLPEQALFRWLGVFVGGVALEAAEALVAGVGDVSSFVAGDLSGGLVLEGLSVLVDHRLLRRDESDGDVRYVMLETVQEFGDERLSDFPGLLPFSNTTETIYEKVVGGWSGHWHRHLIHQFVGADEP